MNMKLQVSLAYNKTVILHMATVCAGLFFISDLLEWKLKDIGVIETET